MDSDQLEEWFEQCHVCGKVDHFRELEQTDDEEWTCIDCVPRFNPNDPTCLEAIKSERDVATLEALWLLESTEPLTRN
jgi:hypothetical protein